MARWRYSKEIAIIVPMGRGLETELSQEVMDSRKLDNLADIHKALKSLAIRVERNHVDLEKAGLLKEIYALIFKILQDRRDNKYKQRLAALWSEYQKRLKAPRVSQGALTDTSVIDVTPVGDTSPVRTAESSPNEEIKSAQVEMSVSNGEDK